jgi:hypothetical protein
MRAAFELRIMVYAGTGFLPKGQRHGFSTITFEEKCEETRTLEAKTGSQ